TPPALLFAQPRPPHAATFEPAAAPEGIPPMDFIGHLHSRKSRPNLRPGNLLQLVGRGSAGYREDGSKHERPHRLNVCFHPAAGEPFKINCGPWAVAKFPRTPPASLPAAVRYSSQTSIPGSILRHPCPDRYTIRPFRFATCHPSCGPSNSS